MTVEDICVPWTHPSLVRLITCPIILASWSGQQFIDFKRYSNQSFYSCRGNTKKPAPSSSTTNPTGPSSVDSSPGSGPSLGLDPVVNSSGESGASATITASSSSQPTSSAIDRQTSDDIALIDRDQLDDQARRKILENKWKPPTGFAFPKNTQNRRYSVAWEEKFPWLQYSPSADGAFCGPCTCFATPQSLTNPEFLTKPFKDWKNACGTKRGSLRTHDASDAHQAALKTAGDFLAICKAEKKSITEHLSQAYHERVERNRKALLSILDVIISLSRRGIPLRGSWDKDTCEEDSNFNFFVKWKAMDNIALASHMQHCPRNAQYLSPKIQNEFLDCFANVLRSDIITQAMKSDFFSIMADESSDQSHVEQLSLCIRYLHKNKHNGSLEVAEDFIGFVALPETSAATITDAMITQLTNWKVNLQKWRGKGFDGAATMSGHRSGVTTRIQEVLPQAKYFTHCRNHCLNLVIVNTCQNVPEVRNFMDSFKEMTFFISNSDKRKHIMKSIISENVVNNITMDADEHEEELLLTASRRQSLPTLSDTRWLSRVDSISTLLVQYSQIYQSMEEIAAQSRGQSKHDANAYVKRMGEFPYIMSAVMTQYILAYIRPLSVALQSKTCDLVYAHTECQSLITLMKSERNQETFKKLYDRATHLLKKTFGEDQEPDMPRTNARKRQMHRANAPSSNPQEYYRVNYFYPFLDHVITHLEMRFPAELKNAMFAYYLIPSKLSKLTEQAEQSILEEYMMDLPMPDTFGAEVSKRSHFNCAMYVWSILHFAAL